ncbi:hypothetical protein IE53DRAFT_257234 [Violaceomyces palustris]|uniref:Uncharacterized protein n=1 Tax=Violaceomyces palustris TaxID=1673888 RepID=A0ACD0NNC1_9BASI|nr:hypothetical protein IE53DRAFT_257234 [Violaceomyces palustris]
MRREGMVRYGNDDDGKIPCYSMFWQWWIVFYLCLLHVCVRDDCSGHCSLWKVRGEVKGSPSSAMAVPVVLHIFRLLVMYLNPDS